MQCALSGVRTRGLHTTLTQIISVTGTHLLLRLNATVDANGVGTVVDETGATVPYSVRDELDSDLFRDVVELDTHFLLDGLEHIAQLYKAEGQRTLTGFNSFALGFSIVTVVALVALFVLVKLPHISVMDTDMKRLRGVLLLLPIQVVRAVPSIRVLNRTIAQQHHKTVGKLDDTTIHRHDSVLASEETEAGSDGESRPNEDVCLGAEGSAAVESSADDDTSEAQSEPPQASPPIQLSRLSASTKQRKSRGTEKRIRHCKATAATVNATLAWQETRRLARRLRMLVAQSCAPSLRFFKPCIDSCIIDQHDVVFQDGVPA